MQISDRAVARNQEWRVVKITEVNPSSMHFAAEDQYGTPILLTLMGGIIQEIPAVGEQWYVSRQGSDWRLENRLELPDTRLPITSMKPGDARVEASGTITITSSESSQVNYGKSVYGSDTYGGTFSIKINGNSRIDGDTKITGGLEVGEYAVVLTPPVGDSSQRVATTIWVTTVLTPYALLNSPIFTGTPSAPTPSVTDNSNRLATTKFVWNHSPQIIAQDISLGPPSSPNDGDIWIATNVDANGTVWQFRYNAGSASAYKWEFIGGAPAYSAVDTSETVLSASTWLDPATVGPSITCARGGDYRVLGTCGAQIVTGADSVQMGVAIGAGTPPVSASATLPTAGYNATLSIQHTFLSLSASAELRMRYQRGGNNDTFNTRRLTVTPVRVS